jgi:HSP20 family protein
MDAWKEGDEFVVEFDIPGIDPADVELDIERNVLTVRAERKSRAGEDVEMIAEERPQGSFSRQIMLSDNLDHEAAKATYESGVLTVRIPVVEKKESHRIEITGSDQPKEIDT